MKSLPHRLKNCTKNDTKTPLAGASVADYEYFPKPKRRLPIFQDCERLSNQQQTPYTSLGRFREVVRLLSSLICGPILSYILLYSINDYSKNSLHH